MPSAAPLVVDLVVIVLVLLAARRGWHQGGATVALRVASLVAGLLVGLRCAALLSDAMGPVAHVVLGLLCVLGGVVIGAAVGRRLVGAVTHRPPGLLGRGSGAVLRGALAAVGCGLVLAVAAAFGPPSWTATIDAAELAPTDPADVPGAGAVWSQVAGVVRDAAPADLAALVPSTSLAGPTDATVAAVDRTVGDSVVAVSASACGRGVTGTGFVTGRGGDLVVTNAHVVAGADTVSAGNAAATVVAFDVRSDLAVLRVPDLGAAPLPLADTDAPNGAELVVVGYPGGTRSAVGATVVQRLPVPNPGFTGGVVLHQSYRLRAVIHHGNSGSPLLTPSGQVVGVVNASSEGADPRGYAISGDELRPLLNAAAAARTSAVSTGACRTTP